jgi:glycine betaine/proline transport system ATP-binding protein
MQDEFLRLQKLLKKTIVFITHDFDEAVRLADRIGIMKDGQLVQMATPEQMVAAPANDYVRAFTKNAPRERIITVGAIAGKAKTKTGGRPIAASVKIGDAAAQVLSSDCAIAVVDGRGKPVGSVTREGMIAALFPDSVT